MSRSKLPIFTCRWLDNHSHTWGRTIFFFLLRHFFVCVDRDIRENVHDNGFMSKYTTDFGMNCTSYKVYVTPKQSMRIIERSNSTISSKIQCKSLSRAQSNLISFLYHILVVQIDIPAEQEYLMTGGGLNGVYRMDQMHFHWASEHTIDSKR